MKLFTIGFTKKSAETFFTRLRRAGVKRLVDVRRRPIPSRARPVGDPLAARTDRKLEMIDQGRVPCSSREKPATYYMHFRAAPSLPDRENSEGNRRNAAENRAAQRTPPRGGLLELGE